MAHERQFCRDVAIARGDPLAGMGTAAARYLLVHWPRGAWRVPRATSRDMPPELSEAILAATAMGSHVALVDGDDIAFSVHGRIRRHCPPEEIARLLPLLADGMELDGDDDDRHVILCCTDGKQDPCCARYGNATWRALRDTADPMQFRVLQSTHLGGCRFAASLVHLPPRHRYGRLTPADVSVFLDALARSQVYLPAYRGNPLLPAVAQVAEHAAMTWAQARGLSATMPVFVHTPAPTGIERTCHARIDIADHRLSIRLTLAEIATNTRCVTIMDGSEPACVNRWQVAGMDVL